MSYASACTRSRACDRHTLWVIAYAYRPLSHADKPKRNSVGSVPPALCPAGLPARRLSARRLVDDALGRPDAALRLVSRRTPGHHPRTDAPGCRPAGARIARRHAWASSVRRHRRRERSNHAVVQVSPDGAVGARRHHRGSVARARRGHAARGGAAVRSGRGPDRTPAAAPGPRPCALPALRDARHPASAFGQQQYPRRHKRVYREYREY